jgi:hypothetical protein
MLTPGELLAACRSILGGPLSPEDLATWVAIISQDGLPSPSRLAAFNRDARVRAAQGSAPVVALAERHGVSERTVYRAIKPAQKRRTCQG